MNTCIVLLSYLCADGMQALHELNGHHLRLAHDARASHPRSCANLLNADVHDICMGNLRVCLFFHG